MLTGVWFFHCHIEFHADIGMGLLIQVGDKEDMPPVPKNFPKCGNWHYTGDSKDEEDTPVCVNKALTHSPSWTSYLAALFVLVVLVTKR